MGKVNSSEALPQPLHLCDPEQLLTIQELAASLRVPESTLQELVRRGKLSACKFNRRHTFVRVADALEYLRTRTTGQGRSR